MFLNRLKDLVNRRLCGHHTGAELWQDQWTQHLKVLQQGGYLTQDSSNLIFFNHSGAVYIIIS
jgi:hypothetical protein